MNVLIIGEYFPPDLGGAASRASNVAKGLSLNGCNVTVVTAFPHYPSGKIPKEYKYKPLKLEYAGKARVIRTLVLPLESKGLFRRLIIFISFMASSLFALPLIGKVDVIWTGNPDVFVLAPAIVYGSIKRKPIVANVDDLLIEDLYDLDLVRRGSTVSYLAESFARVLFAKVRAATPISPGYVPTIARYGVDEPNIIVVRGGVDLSVFKVQATSKTNDYFVVLYSGGFSIAYDFEQIFQAAKTIAGMDERVKFIIQGKGELLTSMRLRAKDLQLSNVEIIDKLLSREEVARLLSQAEVLVLPLASFKTPYRGMSSKLYEYQAMEKPIICCSNGFPSDYVRKTNSGLTVNPGDSEALVSAIFRLKHSPAEARLMARNGRNFVEQEASIQAIGLKLKRILEQIIASK